MKQSTARKTRKPNLKKRTQKLIDFDNEIRQKAIMQNFRGILCGVDEVGRGPVAGPVVAAAVIFSDDVFIKGVFDSKQVPRERREELYEEIIASAMCYGIGVVHSKEIDSINIFNASKLAMTIAISKLVEKPCIIVADGNFYKHDEITVQNVVKGDEKSFSVAASSIIAKVTRDRMMCEYQNQYPNYSFSSHKGYCTIAHIDEIMEYGYTDIHRRSFKLKAIQGDLFA